MRTAHSDQESMAFNEGVAAKINGVPVDTNPYLKTIDCRVQSGEWLIGWCEQWSLDWDKWKADRIKLERVVATKIRKSLPDNICKLISEGDVAIGKPLTLDDWRKKLEKYPLRKSDDFVDALAYAIYTRKAKVTFTQKIRKVLRKYFNLRVILQKLRGT